MTSSPRWQCAISAAQFDCVPDGKKSPASMPNRSAQASCSRFTVGSSPKTSSPTSARAMASRIAGVGWVTVSLRRSIGFIRVSGQGSKVYPVPRAAPKRGGSLTQPRVELRERRGSRAELALAELVERLRDGIEVRMQVARLRVDVEQPGDDLSLGIARLHVGHRGDAVGSVVAFLELAQAQHRAVVLAHFLDGTGRIVGRDFGVHGD